MTLLSILMIASPILIAAAGGMICERAGVKNIALEGLMSAGAMTAAASHVLLETQTGFSIPLALIFAALSGCLLSLIHAFASVTLKANQIISGMGINLLSGGLTVFICQLVFRMDRSMSFRTGMLPHHFGIYPVVWIALIILAASWFMLYKNTCGFYLRAAGENPQALAAAGVNVSRVRYTAILISGLLAGLAGACVVLTQDTQFTVNTIGGKGFFALAAVYIGRKLPLGVLGASLLIGLALSFTDNIFNIKSPDLLSVDVLNMLPYLIALIALVVFCKKDLVLKAFYVDGKDD